MLIRITKATRILKDSAFSHAFTNSNSASLTNKTVMVIFSKGSHCLQSQVIACIKNPIVRKAKYRVIS